MNMTVYKANQPFRANTNDCVKLYMTRLIVIHEYVQAQNTDRVSSYLLSYQISLHYKKVYGSYGDSRSVSC
jgi:hypothetical protein